MMAVMARTPDHPSGTAVPVTLRLSPAHLEKLDKIARSRGVSRSKLAMHIIDRLDPA